MNDIGKGIGSDAFHSIVQHEDSKSLGFSTASVTIASDCYATWLFDTEFASWRENDSAGNCEQTN